MKRITVESTVAGMRLARAITNDLGVTLFGEGTVLDERTIERIKTLGIDYIYVEGHSPPRKSIDEEMKELEKRFSKVTNVPYMTTIKTAVKEYISSLYDEYKADQRQD